MVVGQFLGGGIDIFAIIIAKKLIGVNKKSISFRLKHNLVKKNGFRRKI